jgi:endonuclease/exonuclease/phosphatase family metal-dependent hydrolase
MTDTQAPSPAGRQVLKIMSYNVHSCIGTDRKLDPGRVTEVIADVEPDIIGLQELDVGRSRTGGVDQAHIIASMLDMKFHFHAALNVEEERYGDAILTTLPMRLAKADMLPSHGEQRGALWVEITAGEKRLQVFNTHLGLRRGDRLRQTAVLHGHDWLGHSRCRDKPQILIGDMNSVTSSRVYRNLVNGLKDVQDVCKEQPRPTFPSRFPLLRLDHIFVSRDIRVLDAAVVTSRLARRASDHLPLVATIEV